MKALTRKEKDEYRKRLRPMFYDVHAQRIEIMRSNIEKKKIELNKAEIALKRYEKHAKDVEHNLGRAADSDLKGCHFIFFGREML